MIHTLKNAILREKYENKVSNRFDSRIDICLFGSFSEYGGIQKSLANLIEVWANQGLRIEIINWRNGLCFYPEQIGHLVSTKNFGTKSKYSTLFALWRYLFKKKPKAILSATHLSNLILAWLRYLPDTGTRRIVRVPNTFSAMQNKSDRDINRKLRQVKFFYPLTHGVIAVSEGVGQDLIHSCSLTPSLVHTIYTPCYTPSIHHEAQESVEHPWLVSSRDRPVIISAGRLAEQKDQCTLIDALAHARREMDCRLIIVGEGPLREKIQARAREKGVDHAISLPGFVPNPYAWIAKADCFALSSIWEGFGRVLAEAMCLGIPLVSTDCPSGPAEILNHGEYGHLVPMRDSKALSEAILRVLQSVSAHIPPQEATKRFHADVAAKQYLQLFQLEETD